MLTVTVDTIADVPAAFELLRCVSVLRLRHMLTSEVCSGGQHGASLAARFHDLAAPPLLLLADHRSSLS